MNFSSFLAIVLIATLQLAEGFTVEQMKKIAAPIKESCIQSTNVEEAMVIDITSGKLVNNEKLKCFLYCIYESVGTMTNGKLNYEDTVQGIESYFPHELKNDTRTAFENCKHVDHMDGCEAAYLLTSCLLKEHPKLFFP